jgi:hypothetical protein
VLGEALHHRVAALAVHAAEHLDLGPPVELVQVGGDRELAENRGTERRGLLRQDELLPDGVRRERPADPEARREDLRERPEVQDVVGVQRAQRGQRLGVEREQAVGVVLDDQQVVLAGDGDHLVPAAQALGDPGRVLEVRDRVEELDSSARGPQRHQGRAERDRVDALVVHADVDDLALVGVEGAQRADVAGPLGQHDVPGIAEHARDKVERLLGAAGDDDVVGVGVHLLLGHHLDDLVAHERFALAGAVLHRLGAALGDQPVDGLGEGLPGEVGDVGHAAGERDHLGPVRHGEQGAHGRHLQPVRAFGVGVHVGVQPGIPTGRFWQAHPHSLPHRAPRMKLDPCRAGHGGHR